MSTIDIRKQDNKPIDTIIFADRKDSDFSIALGLEKGGGLFSIYDEVDTLNIHSKEHAKNLIKALNKAIELGWVD